VSKLARLTGHDREKIEDYLQEGMAAPEFNRLREQLQGEAAIHGGLEASCGLAIYITIRALQPKVVVETGVAGGASSTYILLALAHNGVGRLYSVDLPAYQAPREGIVFSPGSSKVIEFPRGKDVGWLVPGHLRSRWRLSLGPSREVLPGLIHELEDLDLFFHDSDHSYENIRFELQTVWSSLRTGGFLTGDNVYWNTAWQDFLRGVSHGPLVGFCMDLGRAPRTAFTRKRG